MLDKRRENLQTALSLARTLPDKPVSSHFDPFSRFAEARVFTTFLDELVSIQHDWLSQEGR